MAKSNLIDIYQSYSSKYKLYIYKNKSGVRGTLKNTEGKIVESVFFGNRDFEEGIENVLIHFGFDRCNSQRIRMV